MRDHHARAMANLKNRFAADAATIALIINGSVARGDARDDSDLDFCLVVDEARREELAAKDEIHVEANDCCAAPCPEANGLVFSKKGLEEIRAGGSEFLRWAFTDAQVAFSRDAEIADIVRAIPDYPEAGRIRRMESFHSQVHYHFSFFEFACCSRTTYLVYETAVRMLLAAGRLILADNRRLYPGRKWFIRELERAPDKPEGWCAAMTDFLGTPEIESGRRIIDMLRQHKPYPSPPEGMKARILKESILNLEEW